MRERVREREMGRERVSKTKEERGRIKCRDLRQQSIRAVRERQRGGQGTPQPLNTWSQAQDSGIVKIEHQKNHTRKTTTGRNRAPEKSTTGRNRAPEKSQILCRKLPDSAGARLDPTKWAPKKAQVDEIEHQKPQLEAQKWAPEKAQLDEIEHQKKHNWTKSSTRKSTTGRNRAPEKAQLDAQKWAPEKAQLDEIEHQKKHNWTKPSTRKSTTGRNRAPEKAQLDEIEHQKPQLEAQKWAPEKSRFWALLPDRKPSPKERIWKEKSSPAPAPALRKDSEGKPLPKKGFTRKSDPQPWPQPQPQERICRKGFPEPHERIWR